MDHSFLSPEPNPIMPPLTASQQILLVQASFAEIAPQADLVTDLFFARLFQLDPTRRAPLPNDLRALKGQFMYALTRAVRDLNPSLTMATVEAGNQGTVSNALLWTLEQGLGEQFTGDVREAWTAMCPQLTPRLGLRIDDGRRTADDG